MGFFRRSYGLGRKVLPWVLAGTAIFGTYKYGQYKAARETQLISRLGKLEDDNATLREDYLERKKDEAYYRDRTKEMRKEAKEASESLRQSYQKDREEISRETAEARRAYVDFRRAIESEKHGLRAEADAAKKELREIPWPQNMIVESPVYTGFKGDKLTKDQRAKMARILAEKMRETGSQIKSGVYENHGHRTKKGGELVRRERVTIIRPFKTPEGEVVVHFIEWVDPDSSNTIGEYDCVFIIGTEPKESLTGKAVERYINNKVHTESCDGYAADLINEIVGEQRDHFLELVVDAEMDGLADRLFRRGLKISVDPEVLQGIYCKRITDCLQALDRESSEHKQPATAPNPSRK